MLNRYFFISICENIVLKNNIYAVIMMEEK